MAKGGARSRSGPAPDPNALRRERDEGEWTALPAAGRPGPAPTWPLPGQSDREATLWGDLWVTPQALMWERHHLEHTVALYVRRLAEAELPDSAVALSTLCRQMADGLGLSTPGLRANRWTIDRAAEEAGTAAPPARPSSRGRLKVVGSDVEGT